MQMKESKTAQNTVHYKGWKKNSGSIWKRLHQVRGGGKGGWMKYNVILSRLCCFPGLRQQQNGKNNEQKLNK